MSKKHKKMQFLTFFEDNLGNISQTCKMIGIDRKTYYNWIKTDMIFKSQIDDILESKIDFVESKLLEKIKENDLRAIIFYLKTKAKHRGYSEQYEIENKTTQNFDNNIKIYLPKKEEI